MTNGVFTEAQVIAAMQAVEAETIVRCEAVAAAYARHAGKKAQSRIAAARAKAAQEIAAEIRKLPRKPVGGAG